MSKFNKGDHVIICGVNTVLQSPLECDGGWIVMPAVQDIRYWNEDEMTKETKGDNLVRRLYENDDANALCNEAARFIERQLKNEATGKGTLGLNYSPTTPPEYR